MNRLFNMDSPLWRFLTRCCDTLIASALWLLASLPIITLGVSTAALYQTAHKTLLGDEGYVVRTFVRSFRGNLKQGILCELLELPVAAVLIVFVIFAGFLGKDHPLGVFYRIAAIVGAVLLLMFSLYLWPTLSRFIMTVPNLFRTSLALAVTRFGFSILLTVIFLLCASACLAAPVMLFVMPGLCAMAAERLIEPAFAKALAAKEAADENS